MGKTYIDTVKYMVYADVEIDGLVDKPDVVGAIFGQTEGLLGDELDLRDLQKNGRIGRIEVELNPVNGKTIGKIKIPSSLDMVETCIIAAALETVDRVGPCEAKIKVEKVEDTRNMKRKMVIEKAKMLLKTLLSTEIPESKEIADKVREEVKTAEIIEYGPDRLPAGPGVERMDEVIFVEGRADVLNLLKNDITNVIAIQGARVTKTIVDLSKKKEVTVFLDGDRGGDIILNELIQGGVEIDFVARAPTGKEVEELSRKEIIKCLRGRIPFEQANTHLHSKASNRRTRVSQIKKETVKKEKKEKREEKAQEKEKKERTSTSPNRSIISKPISQDKLLKELEELKDTLKAKLYDEDNNLVAELPVRDVIKAIGEREGLKTIIFDGIITQRLVDLAANKGIKTIVGMKVGNVNKKPEGVEIITPS